MPTKRSKVLKTKKRTVRSAIANSDSANPLAAMATAAIDAVRQVKESFIGRADEPGAGRSKVQRVFIRGGLQALLDHLSKEAKSASPDLKREYKKMARALSTMIKDVANDASSKRKTSSK